MIQLSRLKECHPENNCIIFTKEDMEWFAESSHDYNPLHMDREFAKTTVYGVNVVFGMLGVTYTLKRFDLSPDELKIQFVKPMFLGHIYTYKKEQKNGKQHIFMQENGTTVLEIAVGGGYSQTDFRAN